MQKIIDGAVLTIDSVLITNPQLNNFGIHLVGSITNAGPFDATITATSGLTVYWNGASIGQLAIPPLTAVGDVGVNVDLDGAFTVADVGHLTDFTRYLVTEPSFRWDIRAADLTVAAIGIVVDRVSLSKTVELQGLNGLKNGVSISHFDLPSNDPAGGIHLVIDTSIVNPSTVGLVVDAISFTASFGQSILAEIANVQQFVLAPKSTFSATLAGRLLPQSSQQGLADVSTLFSGCTCIGILALLLADERYRSHQWYPVDPCGRRRECRPSRGDVAQRRHQSSADCGHIPSR